jgi:Domain of unknown function (DUF4180)
VSGETVMSGDELIIESTTSLGLRVDVLADVPELVAAAYSLDGLMVQETDLGPEFFRLSSGVAGELFQKLVNYRIPTAVVIKDFSVYGERFAELASEHSRHLAVRFIHTEDEAKDWLATQL